MSRPDRPTPPLRRASRWGATHARPPGLIEQAGRPPTGPLMRGLRDAPATDPSADPDEATPSAWTEAKVQAVLEALRSFISNSARKHGVPAEDVMSLVKDHLVDPD